MSETLHRKLTIDGNIFAALPSGWVTKDIELRQECLSLASEAPGFWNNVRWFTQERIAIEGWIVFSVIVGFFLRKLARKDKFKLGPELRGYSVIVIIFTLLLGIADFLSWLLKHFFGRFKPALPGAPADQLRSALSFPSSHAFTMTFAVSLIWLAFSSPTRKKWWPLLTLLFSLAAFVGVSRIFVGEHYPLDVAAGWLLGFVGAWIFAPEFRRACRYFLPSDL